MARAKDGQLDRAPIALPRLVMLFSSRTVELSTARTCRSVPGLANLLPVVRPFWLEVSFGAARGESDEADAVGNELAQPTSKLVPASNAVERYRWIMEPSMQLEMTPKRTPAATRQVGAGSMTGYH